MVGALDQNSKIGLLDLLTGRNQGNDAIAGLTAALAEAAQPSKFPSNLGAAIGRGAVLGRQFTGQREEEDRQKSLIELKREQLLQASIPEQFTPVRGPGGNILGQQSSKTGRVVDDPRATAAKAKFEAVVDAQGNIVAQRNTLTNEVKTDPRAEQQAKKLALAGTKTKEERDAAKVKFQNENALRDDFVKQSADFIKVRDSFQTINEVAKNPSAAGDVSMIFAFMKMLDPGSTVREGEQATAANARGVPDQIASLYNRVITGETLTPEQRQDFMNNAQAVFNARIEDQNRITQQFTDIAVRSGIDPSNVIIDFGTFSPAGAAVPTGPITGAPVKGRQTTIKPSGPNGAFTMQDLQKLAE